MATPKLDRIISEFSRRIGQPASFDGAGNLLDRDGMTALEFMAYVNRAMFKLIEDTWLKVQGDEKAFIRIFPELVKTKQLDFAEGAYFVTMTEKDFAYLIDGRIIPLGVPAPGEPAKALSARKLPQEQFNMAMSYALPYNPTAANPAMIVIQNKIYLFPTNLFYEEAGSVQVLYIALPLDPATGAFLTQNGTLDSPFLDSHNTLIAEIAESLYRADSQDS